MNLTTIKKEMVGFDIDMTKELVKIMNKNGGNYSYKFKALSFDAISSSLTSDQVDLGISGFTYHKDWKTFLSHAYNTSEQIALVKVILLSQKYLILKVKRLVLS